MIIEHTENAKYKKYDKVRFGRDDRCHMAFANTGTAPTTSPSDWSSVMTLDTLSQLVVTIPKGLG